MLKEIRIYLLSILMIVFFIFGCANLPVANPVCPQEGSWICEQSAKHDIQPETVYGWIYSATAIAAVSDVMSIQEICDFEKRIADWYVSVYPMSYTAVISKIAEEAGLISDSKKAMLINNILNQNLMLYDNSEFISEADDVILRKGHTKFRKDMFCN